MTRESAVVEATSAFPQPPTPTESSVKQTEPPTPKAPQPAAASAPRVDRFAELVASEATILRQFRPGVLTAVVRPDPGSELRIELRLHRGQVEARASLERGDAEAYQAAWGDLQNHLRSQGIDLQPLGSFPSTASKKEESLPGSQADAGSRDGRPSHRPAPHEGVPRMVAFGNLPDLLQPSGSAPASSGVVGGTRHLLESWA